MILKGSKRAGSKQLADHLLNAEQNEHVFVEEVRGFMTGRLDEALQEIYALSRANPNVKKFMLSMSINPPIGKTVSAAKMVDAVNQAEQILGVTGQPRVIVFHEKEGRRHAHCVWSLLNENLKIIKLPYFKTRLTELSRDLYLQHGWELPRGLQNKQERDRTNFNLAEWQAAKRHKLNPKEVKAKLQALWHGTHDLDSFKQALSQEGYQLARGEVRSFVLVDPHGEVRSLSRALSVKAKDIKAKLGDHEQLPDVDEAKQNMSQTQKTAFDDLQQALTQKHNAQLVPLKTKLFELVATQRKERENLDVFHMKRQQQERTTRQSQYKTGLKGLWRFVTRRYHKQKQQHEAEYQANLKRDSQERENLIGKQLKTRQTLQHSLDTMRETHQSERLSFITQHGQHDLPTLAQLSQTQNPEWTL